MAYKRLNPDPVNEGGTGNTSFVSNAPVCGGTTTTGALQSASTGISNTGYVLTSTGASSIPTFQAVPSTSLTFDGDTGSATPSAGIINIKGGTTGLTTAASGSTVSLTGTLDVANGGTGATILTGVLSGNGTAPFTASPITQYDVLLGGSSNTIVSETPSTAGYVLTSNGTAANPTFQTISASGAITTITGNSGGPEVPTSAGNFNIVGIGGVLVTGSLNTETISITGGGLTWVTVTGSTQAMAANTGYVGNNATLITFTLPATAAVGDTYIIEGLGTGGWTITLNSGQLIHMGNLATTVTSGSLSSTNQYDSVTINCVVANTTFTVRGSMGNIIVV